MNNFQPGFGTSAWCFHLTFSFEKDLFLISFQFERVQKIKCFVIETLSTFARK